MLSRRITRGTRPRSTRASCTDSMGNRTDGTGGAGIIRRPGPRTGPGPRLHVHHPATLRNVTKGRVIRARGGPSHHWADGLQPDRSTRVAPADQGVRRSRRDCGPPPSAMRPWAPGSGGRAGHGRRWNGPRTGTEIPTDGSGRPRTRPVGAVTPTVRPAFWLFTWHFRIPNQYHRLPRRRSRTPVTRKAGTRTLHSIRRSCPVSR
jgi:hypothetical protein